tara:strand:- start:703 stop:1080 length:378 start_codon:yes stop_codon:yes gene_type:complete
MNENLKLVIDLPFIGSAALNIILLGVIALLIWYCFKLLKKIYFISDTIGGINQRITEFLNHLESVYSLDTFYGEPTLQELITHGKELKEFVDDYMLEVIPDNYIPELEEEEGEDVNDNTNTKESE